MNYVSAVLGKSVEIVTVETLPPGLALGARRDGQAAHLPFASKAELAAVLTALQRAGFLFAEQPGGWPPAAVFQQLRDEKLVNGVVRTVSWAGPGEPVFGEA